MQRREKRRFGHRRLTLRENVLRAMAVLHLRSVEYDDDKLELLNSSGGDLWIEVVRLCTAKLTPSHYRCTL